MQVPDTSDILKEDDLTDDPLSFVLARISEGETRNEMIARLKLEAKAKCISDAFDDEIKARKSRKNKKVYQVLLLGQSESGKSTALKNFQLIHSPEEFRNERSSWRSVVYLNIARSVRIVLDAISRAQQRRPSRGEESPTTDLTSFPSDPSIRTAESSLSSGSSTFVIAYASQLTGEHHALLKRLEEVRAIEHTLMSRLAAKGETEATRVLPENLRELIVRSTSKWKGRVNMTRALELSDVASGRCSTAEREREDAYIAERDEERCIGAQLRDAKSDIESMWNDPIIRGLKKVKGLRMEERPGFFLDQLDRVTADDYTPSDDDVLKARVKTLGVTEHTVALSGSGDHHAIKIYDVGGTRPQRQFWVPYFDNADAIIFLAPISSFDQVLQEDPGINRLEDSLHLWASINKNKLLTKVNIILFLNKCDLLERKLRSGIQFKDSVKSFEERTTHIMFRVYVHRSEDKVPEYSKEARKFEAEAVLLSFYVFGGQEIYHDHFTQRGRPHSTSKSPNHISVELSFGLFPDLSRF